MATKRYIFTLEISGLGTTPEQAWIDACGQFGSRLEEVPDQYEISDEEFDAEED
jgi:hypothetical protein